MSITMYKPRNETSTLRVFGTLRNQFSAYLGRRRTIRLLKACNQRDLQDVGIIPQDIFEIEYFASPNAMDDLSSKARLRARNW